MSPVRFLLVFGAIITLLHAYIIISTTHLREHAARQTLALERQISQTASVEVEGEIEKRDIWFLSKRGDDLSVINASGVIRESRELINILLVIIDDDFASVSLKHASKMRFDENQWFISGMDFPSEEISDATSALASSSELQIQATFDEVVNEYLAPNNVSVFNLLTLAERLEASGKKYLEYRLEFFKLLGLLLFPAIVLLWVHGILINFVLRYDPNYMFKTVIRVFVISIAAYIAYRPLSAYATTGAIPIEAIVYLPHLVFGVFGAIISRRSYFL